MKPIIECQAAFGIMKRKENTRGEEKTQGLEIEANRMGETVACSFRIKMHFFENTLQENVF